MRADRRGLGANVGDRASASCVVNVTCTPPLKSMPKLSPRTPSETRPISSTTPEIANQRVAAAHEVDLQELAALRHWCAPMNLGLLNQRKPASRPSIARVAATAVISETTVPISSIRAKPFTSAVATANRISAVIAVTTFASMNRAEALRITGRDRGAHGLPGAHFFLDAFEDDDVRVGGDADREDQAGEARQGQRDAEEQDRAVHERGVDRETDHRDDAQEAVEQEQEHRDDDQAAERRLRAPG